MIVYWNQRVLQEYLFNMTSLNLKDSRYLSVSLNKHKNTLEIICQEPWKWTGLLCMIQYLWWMDWIVIPLDSGRDTTDPQFHSESSNWSKWIDCLRIQLYLMNVVLNHNTKKWRINLWDYSRNSNQLIIFCQ